VKIDLFQNGLNVSQVDFKTLRIKVVDIQFTSPELNQYLGYQRTFGNIKMKFQSQMELVLSAKQ
jgi:hypothetical protein